MGGDYHRRFVQFAGFHLERVQESGSQGSSMQTIHEDVGRLDVVVDISFGVSGEDLDGP